MSGWSRGGGSFRGLGVVVPAARLEVSCGSSGVEASEPRCRGPSGLLMLRLLSRGVGGSRGYWVPWASRSHGVDGCMGHEGPWILRSPRSRRLWAGGTDVAHRASTGKARELVQVGGLGDENAAFQAVNALKACRRGQGLRLRGQRPWRETSRAFVFGELDAAVWKGPGGATNPKRGAVAGEV